MCLLFETIKIAGGKIFNLPLHNDRMNYSRRKLFSSEDPLKLEDYIEIPPEAEGKIIRCRVIYGSAVKSVEYSEYIPAGIRTLKLVDGSNIDYSYKYLDRSSLNALIDKGIADDILIVKNGYLTDCSFANIVFYDGNRWITPATPLLKGTMRELLILNGVISEEIIKVDDIQRFRHFRLVNAMLGFEAPMQPASNIIR